MAKELGFDGLLYNSMNAVADRDFVLETMQWDCSFMLKISRWAEDLIIYSSLEFGFVKLADIYSTGSSLMPQKKNADSRAAARKIRPCIRPDGRPILHNQGITDYLQQ